MFRSQEMNEGFQNNLAIISGGLSLVLSAIADGPLNDRSLG